MVGFRDAVNKPARVAITGLADNSRQSSARAANRHEHVCARGDRHPHADRALARGWLRVSWACWHTDTADDPSRPGGEPAATTSA